MRMKTFVMSVVALATLISCGGNPTKPAESQEAEVAVTVMDVDQLLADAERLADQSIEIEGICTHICKHGATKIFLMGSDDSKTIRVEAAELGSFSRECVNSIVRVKGLLREERVDEAYLQRWEAAVAARAAEQHGDGEAGCDTEKAARGETGNTVAERIADFRTKIAARKAAVGKEYLSFYFIEAQAYEVVE